MFTLEHFIWLGLCAAFVAGLCFLSVKKKFSLKTAGLIMVAICLFSEISKIMSDMIESPKGGMHLDPLSLPFHLCSLMLFGVFFVTFGKDGKARQTVINFLAVMGTLGSFAALMIPTNGVDFGKIFAYQCFVYHAGLLWFGLYLILSGNAKLGGKTLLHNLVFLTVLAFGVIYVNSALSAYDTNFFYLTRPPMENLPYLNLDHGWYVYFLHLLCAGVGLISAFHLPFILAERKKAQNNEKQ